MLTTNLRRLAKTILQKPILVKHSQRALSSQTKDSEKFADFTKYTLTNEIESPYEEEPMQMRESMIM